MNGAIVAIGVFGSSACAALMVALAAYMDKKNKRK